MPGLEDTYHWALVVGPKTPADDDAGTRYHVKHKLELVGTPPEPKPVWYFEQEDIQMGSSFQNLVRILVGKVKNKNKLNDIIRGIPLRSDVPEWNCVEWVKEALTAAVQDGKVLSKCPEDWESVRDTAMWYVAKKKDEHRFDGRAKYDFSKVATWDLVKGYELVM
ncbi:hypothetical protein S40288_01985 [Stachybotrys chartarum IBT 40288]|nr:hypothetical protein S40288_01985 [Stachybotrys chartarum IBT 40288]